MSNPSITAADLEKLRGIGTCTVSNAIERLDVRLRNEGFVSGGVRRMVPGPGPMVGYAATARIRTAEAPIAHRCYYDRMDWWSYVASLPEPRVMVLADADPEPGFGAFVGEIHAAIGMALKCVGCVTNGAVRDLPEAEAMGFQMFAANVSVSHAYAHIVEFGAPVKMGGLEITSGALLHGDAHGVLTVPLSIAGAVPEAAAKILEQEEELVRFCRSSGFSLEELGERIKIASADCGGPWRSR